MLVVLPVWAAVNRYKNGADVVPMFQDSVFNRRSKLVEKALSSMVRGQLPEIPSLEFCSALCRDQGKGFTRPEPLTMA